MGGRIVGTTYCGRSIEVARTKSARSSPQTGSDPPSTVEGSDATTTRETPTKLPAASSTVASVVTRIVPGSNVAPNRDVAQSTSTESMAATQCRAVATRLGA